MSITPDELKVMRGMQPVTRTDFQMSFQAVVRMVRVARDDIKREVRTFLTAALKEIEDRISARLAEVKDGKTPTTSELVALIKPLVPERAKDGETPTDAQLRAIIAPLIPQVENGKDASEVDTEAIISRIEKDLPKLAAAMRDGLELLQGDDRLHVRAIAGLDELIATYVGAAAKNEGYGPGGGTSFALLRSGVEKVQQPSALNFTGAGAPTITHRQSGVTDISFPSSSGGITVETPPEAPDANASRVLFTVSAEPKWMVADGTTYYAGAGYTYSSGTGKVTFDFAPSQFVRAII